MATTKTLTPTNQTITIDAFQGEKPDHRHVADAEGKLADAVNALNSNFANQYGELATGITYQKYGKIVIIYFNGNTVAASTGWTNMLTIPASVGQTRYTVHVKTMSGHDVRIGGDTIGYRGSAGDMFGVIVFIAS